MAAAPPPDLPMRSGLIRFMVMVSGFLIFLRCSRVEKEPGGHGLESRTRKDRFKEHWG